ncbi:two-component system response regulator DegU [Natronobacillus azotifigens]|uniref:Response regulator transcription factor n=1 Tax=Natronobacillus azotifigens TaxID=472978 RepID=A0A9J6RA77_9BACI|nr:response regulator transcription factor [Natronobacillus azotifigens]MCZ0702439.1 response regulator transcription factor [Natronobacillus azotifigens]
MKLLFVKKPSLLRDWIVQLLKRKFPNDEVFTCDHNNCYEYLDGCRTFDLVILDVHKDIPVDTIIQYYQTSTESKIIAWVEDKESPILSRLFGFGLGGYLYYEMEEKEMIEAITKVLAGEKFIHPLLVTNLLEEYVQTQWKKPSPPLHILSNREWEVLQLLSKGYNNVDIATELFLSDKTVKNYVSSILRKLNVPDRTNAVLKALENKWICV